MLSCPSSLQGHSEIPTPTIRRRWTGFTRLVGGLPQAESCGDAGISGLSSVICHRMWYIPVFIGADGLTPGPYQVLMPFASLIALAFSLNREDRRVSLLCRGYPSIGLSQLLPSDQILRGCTIRLTLRLVVRPRGSRRAVLAGTPDWVKPAYSASRLGTVLGQVQPVCYHTNTPQPTYPKWQLIRQPPFRLIDSGLATSYLFKV